MPDLPNPESRVEQYLANLTDGTTEIPKEPESRIEQYLDYLAKNGGAGVNYGTAPAAAAGMALVAKTIVDGKVTEWEFGDAGGLKIHICTSSEYGQVSREPVISSPDEKTLYLVPAENGSSPDLFVEWAYVNGNWEMFGSASIGSIPDSVNEWLTEHITNPDNPPLDRSLTSSSAAAPADLVGEELTNLKQDLSDITGSTSETKSYANGCVAVNTSTIDMTNTHSTDTTYRYVIVPCQEGDIFYIKGKSDSSAIYGLYTWVQSNGTTRISSSGRAECTEFTKITAPENAAYLVSNVDKNYPYGLIKGIYLKEDEQNVEAYLQSYNLFCRKTSALGYISDTGELLSPTARKEISCDYIPVNTGETITVQVWATAGSGNTHWIAPSFYNSEKTYISRLTSEGGRGENYYNYSFKIPANAKYLRISARMYDDGIISATRGAFLAGFMHCLNDIALWTDINPLSSRLEQVERNIVSITGNTQYTDFSSGYIAVNQSTVDINTVVSSADFVHIIVSCSHGDLFYIKGYSGDTTRASLWTFIDSSGNKLSTSGKMYEDDYVPVIAPQSSSKLVVNAAIAHDYGVMKGVPISKRVTALENSARSGYGLSNSLLKPAKPRFAMHRGDAVNAPENTVPAFTLAGQAGVWAIETDVYETTDGYFVLSHDNDVSRMTDGTGNITSMTYAQTQECTIDAGANVGEYPNLKMPLLEDYLKICRRYGCVAFLEIKTVTNYDKLVETVDKAGMTGSVVYMCYYNATKMSTLRSLTGSPILLLGTTTTDIDALIDSAKTYIDTWLGLHSQTVTESVLKSAHANNLPVGAWTISSSSTAESLIETGLDYVIGTMSGLSS